MMDIDIGGGARSSKQNRVSEMTNIVRIKQGFTEPLVASPSQAAGGDATSVAPRELAPVRYVDNLRTAFQIVRSKVQGGGRIALNDVATIHFARWVILPGDEYLLFTANFDGSFEQYIHDFVTVANGEKWTADNPLQIPFMDMIWGNCVGYPGTTDFMAFLDYIRLHMIPTTLFYATLTSTTVRDIEWLRRFRALFVKFDEAASTVARERWPSDLRAAFDELKSGINDIDVMVI